jgi:hypothetical protein
MTARKLGIAMAVLALSAFAVPAVSAAAEIATGRTCVQEVWYDGQGLQHLGSRCAQGSVVYASYDATRWNTDYYKILYSVSAGLSYGPANNENPAWMKSGFAGGTQQWLSPDSGATNTWISRTGFPNTLSYKGQSRFAINAYPDVPNVSDPKLYIETSNW